MTVGERTATPDQKSRRVSAVFWLQASPESAAMARDFVQEHSVLDSMRRAEADLLVTELVGNVVRHAVGADWFAVTVEPQTSRGLRVSVSHPHPHPLAGDNGGIGFTLLNRLARSWGHEHDGSTLSVWFVLRRPGSAGLPAGVSEEAILETLSSDWETGTSELLRRHRDLAVNIARRYRGKGVAEEDLEQVALMALVKAIQRFDPELGELRPYAAATISGEMKRQLRDRAWSVRMPRSVQERVLSVARASDELAQKLERVPRNSEIATVLDITEEEVADAMHARKAYTSKSIYQPFGDTDLSLVDQLGDNDRSYGGTDDRLTLADVITRLPERQQRIMDLRFNHDMNQSEIAEILGISQMHVSRLLSAAIRTIRGLLQVELRPPA